MKEYETTVNSLIELLTLIKEKCGGNTPIQVNVLGSEHVTGLTSVCLDNDTGNHESIVYIETDVEGDVCPRTFHFYTQGEEI